jgi:hypothetical protein
MKRSTLLTLSVVTLVALQAAPALAGKKSRKNDQDQQQNQSQNQQQNQSQRKFNVQSLLNGQPDWQGVFKKHKHHDDDDAPNTPLDPGRPDDRVPVDEPVTPPSRPGYVWVNGHWERERASTKPTVIVDPIQTQSTIVVRDHRTVKPPFVSGGQGQGGVTVTSGNGPIIRDHRDSSTSNGGVTVTSGAGPTIRDHRDSVTIFNPTGSKVWTAGPTVRDHRTITPPPLAGKNGQGGVTVTTTPGGGSRDNAITGSGPNPLDLLAEGAAKVGNVFGIGYGEVTSGDGSAPSGPIVRDHRPAGPVVRDHRTGQ